ncbi:hypothetical protein J5N97_017462 [Dioscorea zingiberensis]|uniref:Uncharacterized protein n=1 Tax=Dioscorea zingiberensis TaxID=325984 RepID=A0A9D5HGL7_9LILI|nr:hypothetical protein J5N97_017462 [Dioscorea zingiberensis]
MVLLVRLSFCYHILDAYADYLRLLVSFARHLRRVPAGPINFRGLSGRIWVVMFARIEATDEVLFDRGWLDFLRDHFVTARHILLFTRFSSWGTAFGSDAGASSSGSGAGFGAVSGGATAASCTAGAVGASSTGASGASGASGAVAASSSGSSDSGDSSGDAGGGGVVVPDKNTPFLTHLFSHLSMG